MKPISIIGICVTNMPNRLARSILTPLVYFYVTNIVYSLSIMEQTRQE